jgi:hypothetical protein
MHYDYGCGLNGWNWIGRGLGYLHRVMLDWQLFRASTLWQQGEVLAL